MDLYPAIDLLGGRCVRLYRGEYEKETVYGDDPASQARAFVAAGARWMHAVDLDAARTGRLANREHVAAVVAASGVPIQCGGGIRSREAAESLFEVGVARVVVGTAALEEPRLVAEIAGSGGRVAVGLDVRGREVAVRGWQEGSGRDVLEVLDGMGSSGAEAVVVTQIERDGTLEGPDLEGLALVLRSSAVEVVASGGVGSLEDLVALRDLEAGGRRLSGVIVGRALYEGAFRLEEALSIVDG